MGTQCLQGCISCRPWHQRHQPAFIGDIERIKPQEFADPPYFRSYWNRTFIDYHGDIGGRSHLIQDRSHTAPGSVPQTTDGGSGIEQAHYQVGQRRSIRDDISHNVQFPARQHDCDPMVADRSGYQYCTEEEGTTSPEKVRGARRTQTATAPLEDGRRSYTTRQTSLPACLYHSRRLTSETGSLPDAVHAASPH